MGREPSQKRPHPATSVGDDKTGGQVPLNSAPAKPPPSPERPSKEAERGHLRTRDPIFSYSGLDVGSIAKKGLDIAERLHHPLGLGAVLVIFTTIIVLFAVLSSLNFVVVLLLFSMMALVLIAEIVLRIKLKDLYKFVILILLFVGFLVVSSIAGIYLFSTSKDRTYDLSGVWHSMYRGKLAILDGRFITPNLYRIKNIENGPNSDQVYEDFILTEIKKSPSFQEVQMDIEGIERFLSSVLHCAKDGDCKTSVVNAHFGRPIHDFWFSYRPVIRHMRQNGWGSNFGVHIENYADQIRLAAP